MIDTHVLKFGPNAVRRPADRMFSPRLRVARTAEALRVAVTLLDLSRPLVGDKSCQPSRKTGTTKRGTSRRVEFIRCPEPLSGVCYTVPPITR